MGVGRKAGHAARKGVPHTLTPARAAQIHRWQLLGAEARKGQKKAARAGHHAALTRQRTGVIGTYANAAKWGVSKLVLPTSLVGPLIPGKQFGENVGKTKKRRRG